MRASNLWTLPGPWPAGSLRRQGGFTLFPLKLDSHLSEQPDRVSVLNVATKSNGDLDTILGSAYVPDPEHPGELLVQFPGSKSASSNSLQVNDYKHLNSLLIILPLDPEGSYWILETDYHNYSVVYSCTVTLSFLLLHIFFVSIVDSFVIKAHSCTVTLLFSISWLWWSLAWLVNISKHQSISTVKNHDEF